MGYPNLYGNQDFFAQLTDEGSIHWRHLLLQGNNLLVLQPVFQTFYHNSGHSLVWEIMEFGSEPFFQKPVIALGFTHMVFGVCVIDIYL